AISGVPTSLFKSTKNVLGLCKLDLLYFKE
ncbi:MAG: hypothetical protein ACI9RV_002285, partial [Glaciecola sp.]